MARHVYAVVDPLQVDLKHKANLKVFCITQMEQNEDSLIPTIANRSSALLLVEIYYY